MENAVHSSAEQIQTLAAKLLATQPVGHRQSDVYSARDILDIFLFQNSLRPDALERLSRKFSALSLSPAHVSRRLGQLQQARAVHVREIERILDTQVDPAVAANLQVAGGAAMIWEDVLRLLVGRLTMREPEP